MQLGYFCQVGDANGQHTLTLPSLCQNLCRNTCRRAARWRFWAPTTRPGAPDRRPKPLRHCPRRSIAGAALAHTCAAESSTSPSPTTPPSGPLDAFGEPLRKGDLIVFNQGGALNLGVVVRTTSKRKVRCTPALLPYHGWVLTGSTAA